MSVRYEIECVSVLLGCLMANRAETRRRRNFFLPFFSSLFDRYHLVVQVSERWAQDSFVESLKVSPGDENR